MAESQMKKVGVESAAKQLGIPANALRIYIRSLANHDFEDNAISSEELDRLEGEIKNRAGNLRLDDLPRIALANEWLASVAIENVEEIAKNLHQVEELSSSITESKSDTETESWQSKVEDLEKTVSKLQEGDGAQAMSLIASVQQMNETQGREVDTLRTTLNDVQKEVKKLASQVSQVVSQQNQFFEALSSALIQQGHESAKSAPTNDGKKNSDPKSEAKIEAAPEEKAAPRFENKAPASPVKIGVVREIEFNFLLERMGFKRHDEYGADYEGDIPIPNDIEIRAFIAKFELGCEPEEVEIVAVQRGEYQMVQYQRVQKGTGLKGWMPSKRKLL